MQNIVSQFNENIKQNKIWYYYIALFILFVIKMLLVANEEILAFYLPHDDLWQIMASKRLFWGGGYRTDSLFHFPVYPIFIEMIRVTGIPLRLATDLIYCCSSLFLLITFEKIKIPIKICLLLAIAILFQPGSFQLPNRCGAEILLTPLMMGAVATAISCFYNREKLTIWLISFNSILWALAWNTRKESVIILSVFAVCAAFLYLSDYKLGIKKISYRIFVIIGIPLLACLLLATAFKAVNYILWGGFTSSVITSSAYVDAFKELQRIKPKEYIAYTPITNEARKIAYANSPAFKKLKPYIEGRLGKTWANYGSIRFYAQKGINIKDHEIAAGWVYWCLYDCVIMAGYGKTINDTNTFWRQVETELKKARIAKKYKSRMVLIPFIDPEIEYWIDRIPNSTERVFNTFISPSVPGRMTQDPVANEAVGDKYDRQANRRTYLIRMNKVFLSGWVTSSNKPISMVSIKNRNNKTVYKNILFIRKDIDLKKNTGFVLSSHLIKSKDDWLNCSFVLNFSDGETYGIKIKELKIGCQVINYKNSRVVIGIDQKDFKKTTFQTWRTQAKLEKYYLKTTKFLSYAILPGLLLFVLVACIKRSIPHLGFVLLILGTLIASRLSLFAILDATSWNGTQPRYIYPVMALYNVFLVLILWQGVVAVCDLCYIARIKITKKRQKRGE